MRGDDERGTEGGLYEKSHDDSRLAYLARTLIAERPPVGSYLTEPMMRKANPRRSRILLLCTRIPHSPTPYIHSVHT